MKTYSVNIVGESHYQRAIKRIREGDRAEIWHEADNEYDHEALAVRCRGRLIGYLPRDSFLKRVMLKDKAPVSAIVQYVTGEGRGKMRGVVIRVAIGGKGEATVPPPTLTREDRPDRPDRDKPGHRWVLWLVLGGLVLVYALMPGR